MDDMHGRRHAGVISRHDAVMIANLHPGPDRRLALHFNNPSVALRPIGRQMGGHAGEVLQYDAHLSFGPHADAEVHRAHSPFWNDRSEEHTSELQSLMPLPYAVFCMK